MSAKNTPSDAFDRFMKRNLFLRDLIHRAGMTQDQCERDDLLATFNAVMLPKAYALSFMNELCCVVITQYPSSRREQQDNIARQLSVSLMHQFGVILCFDPVTRKTMIYKDRAGDASSYGPASTLMKLYNDHSEHNETTHE